MQIYPRNPLPAPFKVRCFRAYERYEEGCYLACGHYGDCKHRPREVLCRHSTIMIDGWPDPVAGWEYCWNATCCPVMNQDPGDEDDSR